MVSCDFLDKEPTKLTPENYFNTPAEANSFLTGIYAILSQPTFYGGDYMYLVAGDDLSHYGGSGRGPASTGLICNNATTSDNAVTAFWYALYSGINRANMFLENIDKVNGFDAGVKEQYIAEAAVLNDIDAADGLENVSVERFIQYYQEGNPNARKVMQDFTHYIGISLNTVLHTFNPDVIVINSSFTNYIPGLIDEITSGIQNRLRWYLHVLPAHLQDVSVLMGGISLCSRNFLGISTFKLLDL